MFHFAGSSHLHISVRTGNHIILGYGKTGIQKRVNNEFGMAIPSADVSLIITMLNFRDVYIFFLLCMQRTIVYSPLEAIYNSLDLAPLLQNIDNTGIN